MSRRLPFALLLAAFFACSHAPSSPSPATAPAGGWVARSNANAQLLLDLDTRFSPEAAALRGVSGVDDQITDRTPGWRERRIAAYRAALQELDARLASEKEPLVAQDLRILARSAALQIRGQELQRKFLVPYAHPARLVFGSIRGLLDPQVEPARWPAAAVRLRKYAGLEPGTRPLAALLLEETRAGLQDRALRAPLRLELETDLRASTALLDGVEKQVREFKVTGADEALAALRAQVADYDRFVRDELSPRTTTDYRLPAPVYAHLLQQVGVDLSADELAALAHRGFDQIQAQMQPLAAQVARARGLPSSDYREVIRALKKERIPDDAMLQHYRDRLAQLEQIIREHRLVSLPERPARIRLGSDAENAQQPAPHMNPPRLIGNRGEQGEFVLPLSNPLVGRYDDFSYPAASWTLTAHEARPGHELQFDRMVEEGVSIARAQYAFNSVNVEGWGLYAEAISLPFMPPEAQLVSLQLRLQRAARAFLDPELQKGMWTPDSARDFLEREVVLSHAFAQSEVDRYTFRSPAQATAYFYGYTRLVELREAAQKKQGARFDALRFHDLVLAQGLLPPDLLREAVLDAL